MSPSATTDTPVAFLSNSTSKINSNCFGTETKPFKFGIEARRDSKYYLDQSVVFLVENTLYKLPSRYFYEHKPQLPTGLFVGFGGRAGEGSSDEHPIKLSPLPYFVKATDFEYLIRIILALTLDLPTPKDYSLDQWLSVLKLSTAWGLAEIAALAMKGMKEDPSKGSSPWTAILDFCCYHPLFSELRDLAICRLEEGNTLTSMNRITLGRKYRIKQWVLEGLRDLVVEPNLPPQKELQALGHETVIRFFYLRDEILGSPKLLAEPTSKQLAITSKGQISGLVEKHFKEDLSRMEEKNVSRAFGIRK